MKQLLVVKPDTISSKDKEKLTKNGFIIIEHPFPGDIRIITEMDGIKGDDMFMSAIEAINNQGGIGVKAEFFTMLFKKLKK